MLGLAVYRTVSMEDILYLYLSTSVYQYLANYDYFVVIPYGMRLSRNVSREHENESKVCVHLERVVTTLIRYYSEKSINV